MHTLKTLTFLIGLRTVGIVLLLAATPAWATNGYFTHGLGPKNKALAGAGSAAPGDAVATAINPAAAVVVGEQFEFGIAFFNPKRSYRATSSQVNGNNGAFTLSANRRIESKNKTFPIPYMGKIWQRGEDSAFAVNFYGRGGMNTEYRSGAAVFDPDGPGPQPVTSQPGTFGAGTTGVDLSQAFLDITYAQRDGSLSWGLSVVLAAQAFEAQGLANFAAFTESFARSAGTSAPDKLTNNGHDFAFGYGFKGGVIWEASRTLNLAASYQSETRMQRFDRYADLFANRGAFNIPANARIGASWWATGRTSLHLDIDRTFYSDVGAVGNLSANLMNCPTGPANGKRVESCLGGNNGAGFGWQDVTAFHFGAETYFEHTPRWLWRAGYSHANSPVRSTEVLFNVLAPGVVEQHYTLGATRFLANHRKLNISAMYAPGARQRGANPFDATQSIELEMSQFELEIGVSW